VKLAANPSKTSFEGLYLFVAAILALAIAGTARAQNTAYGTGALQSNQTGIDETALGYQALYKNTSGNWNTATGDSALRDNTIGTKEYRLRSGRPVFQHHGEQQHRDWNQRAL